MLKPISMSGYLWGMLLFVSLSLFACKQNQAEHRDSSFKFETIALTDLQGNALDPAVYKNKTIFLNFWATWCKPCLKEMPGIAALKKKYSNEPVVFLFATDDAPEDVAGFAAANKYDFDYVLIRNLDSLQVESLPTTCIFDQQGQLQFHESGFRQWDDEEGNNILNQIVNAHH